MNESLSRHIGVMSSAQHHVAHRATNTREMLLLSAGKLFQEVGYVRTSIHRIAAGVNAPKGTFYNYFGSKEELASILVDRQFAAIYQSLSLAPGESAYDQLKHHFHFLATEPPMITIAPLQLLAIFAAEAPAIPPAIGQRIADGIQVWDKQLGDLISLARIEKGTRVSARLQQTSVIPNYMLAWGNRSQKIGPISEACRQLSSLLAPLRCPLISPCAASPHRFALTDSQTRTD